MKKSIFILEVYNYPKTLKNNVLKQVYLTKNQTQK